MIIEHGSEKRFQSFCQAHNGEIIVLGTEKLSEGRIKGENQLILAECQIPVEYCIGDILKIASTVSKDIDDIAIFYITHDMEEFINVAHQWEKVTKENHDHNGWKFKMVDFMVATGALAEMNYVLIEDNEENIVRLKHMGCTEREIIKMRSKKDSYLYVYLVLKAKGYEFTPQKGFISRL